MEMLDRYLKTLKSALPDAQKEDIVRELSENINSEIEDKEAELGRPLNETELEALLRQHGNPLVVASRYRQDQRSVTFGRQLIGPTLFPFYRKVLFFNLGLTGVIILIIFTALLASGQPIGLGAALSILFYNLLIQFSVITLIFTAMDQHLTKHPDRWNPKKPIAVCHPALAAAPADGPRVSQMESISQLIALTVFIVWLRAVRGAPFLILGPAAIFLKAAPVWKQLYAPFVLIALVTMVQSGINLIRPDWVWLRSLVRVATHVVTLIICFFLMRAGTWVVPASDASAGYQHAGVIVNHVIFYSLVAAVPITALMLALELRRLVRGRTTLARKSAGVHR
jgi:hypothetical protein